jgi:hypothetical protein
MIHLRPTLTAAELEDYSTRLWSYVAAESPDVLDVIFGGVS